MQPMAWAQDSSPASGSTAPCPSNLCSASNSALSQYAAANNCLPSFLNPPVPATCCAASVTLDEAKVIAALDRNALPASTGACGHYVRNALQAGVPLGEPAIPHVPQAKNFGPTLVNLGFTAIYDSNTSGTIPIGYTPQKGDVVVIQPYIGDPNNAGHVTMYDGTHWVSDYKQRLYPLHSGKGQEIYNAKAIMNSFYPNNNYRNKTPSYVIYRYPSWSN